MKVLLVSLIIAFNVTLMANADTDYSFFIEATAGVTQHGLIKDSSWGLDLEVIFPGHEWMISAFLDLEQPLDNAIHNQQRTLLGISGSYLYNHKLKLTLGYGVAKEAQTTNSKFIRYGLGYLMPWTRNTNLVLIPTYFIDEFSSHKLDHSLLLGLGYYF